MKNLDYNIEGYLTVSSRSIMGTNISEHLPVETRCYVWFLASLPIGIVFAT